MSLHLNISAFFLYFRFKNAFDTYYKYYIENGYFEPFPTNEVMFDMFSRMIMAYNEKYKQEVPVARLKLKL